MSLSISEIVKKYLVENGFDGLAGEDCGCGVDELFCCSTCEEPMNYDCVAARKIRQERCEECGNAECENYGLESIPEEQKSDKCFYYVDADEIKQGVSMNNDYSELVFSSFIEVFNEVQKKVHLNAVEHGWWEEDRSDGELIALIHSELSEGLEYLRKDESGESDHIPNYLGIEEEYADVIIRIMDHAQKRGWDIVGAIVAKIRYNKTRPYKHGNKKF